MPKRSFSLTLLTPDRELLSNVQKLADRPEASETVLLARMACDLAACVTSLTTAMRTLCERVQFDARQ